MKNGRQEGRGGLGGDSTENRWLLVRTPATVAYWHELPAEACFGGWGWEARDSARLLGLTPKPKLPKPVQVPSPGTAQTMVLYPGSAAAPCPADPFRLEACGGTLAAWSICIRPGDSSPLCWLRTGAPGGGRSAPDKATEGGRATATGSAPRMPRRV